MKKKSIFILLLIALAGFIGMRYFSEDDLDLTGTKVAILLADEYDENETTGVIEYLTDRGSSVSIIGLTYGPISPYNKKNVTRDIEMVVKDIKSSDFDALVIPGGYSPAKLAKNNSALNFVRNIVNDGKICAAICHGPVVLAEAGVIKNRKITSKTGLEGDLKLNGAIWENRKVVVDDNLITSRRPRDQRYFNAAIGLALSEIKNIDNN
ncbi:MAG: DJ-1/PfpI family protein [Clostridia bacterium]